MTHITPSSTEITLDDGSTSTVILYPADHDGAAKQGAEGMALPLVVIWPGFGMGAHYFRPIARWLSDRGFPVAIGELRGQGSSTAKASRKNSWNYHTLVTEDYPLTIAAAKQSLGLEPEHPVVLLAHSLGGQVGTLFLSSDHAGDVIGMMGVGAGSPYWKSFVGRNRSRVGLGAPAMALIARLVGHWPAGTFDLAGYGRQSRRLVGEWARFARTNSLAHVAGARYALATQRVSTPVLLTRFTNDEECTLASAEALAQHIPGARPVVEELPGELGHNSWAREPEIVGKRFVRFYEERLADAKK